MGHNRRWRVLADAGRYGADYVLRCRACGREAIIEQATFRAIAAAWGLGHDVHAIAARLRCEACRHRGNLFDMAAPGLPGCHRLRDGDELPPRGFPLSRWFRMSNGERKRYKRNLRN